MDAILKQRTHELASELATQSSTIEDLNAAMRELMKSALEKMLNTEMDVHLESTHAVLQEHCQDAQSQDGSEPKRTGKNRRNGTSPKTIQGDMGKLPLDIPRDRQGTFEPQLIPKHQRRLAGFDEKILAFYAKGMTTRDIQDIVKELYGVDVSPALISEITEDLDAEVKAWQTRRIDAVFPIVFLDGIVVPPRAQPSS
jgi:putative transposase